jgi:hypothetical protein
MKRRAGINLIAFAVVALGGSVLLGAKPAEAAFDDGCSKMEKLMNEQMTACAQSGGTYSFQGECSTTSVTYTLISSCN